MACVRESHKPGLGSFWKGLTSTPFGLGSISHKPVHKNTSGVCAEARAAETLSTCMNTRCACHRASAEGAAPLA